MPHYLLLTKPIWLNYKAVRAVAKRRKVYRKYKSNSHPACQCAMREAKMAVNESRRKFEKKLAENIQQDSKSFFSYARGNSKSKVRVGPLKNHDGEDITDTEELANVLNDHFSTVFTMEAQFRLQNRCLKESRVINYAPLVLMMVLSKRNYSNYIQIKPLGMMDFSLDY